MRHTVLQFVLLLILAIESIHLKPVQKQLKLSSRIVKRESGHVDSNFIPIAGLLSMTAGITDELPPLRVRVASFPVSPDFVSTSTDSTMPVQVVTVPINTLPGGTDLGVQFPMVLPIDHSMELVASGNSIPAVVSTPTSVPVNKGILIAPTSTAVPTGTISSMVSGSTGTVTTRFENTNLAVQTPLRLPVDNGILLPATSVSTTNGAIPPMLSVPTVIAPVSIPNAGQFPVQVTTSTDTIIDTRVRPTTLGVNEPVIVRSNMFALKQH